MLTTTDNLKFYINNEEVSVEDNFNITLNTKNKSTFRFNNVYPKNKPVTNLYTIPDYSNLTIKQGTTTVFSGVVKLTTNSNITSKTEPKYVSFQAVDNKEWLSASEPVTNVYRNVKAKDIINNMIDTVLGKYGFSFDTSSYFARDEVIIEKGFENAKPYDILNWLSEWTNSKWSANDNKILFFDFTKGYANDNDFNHPVHRDTMFLYKSNDHYEPSINPNKPQIITKVEYQSSRVVDYLNQITIQTDNLISENDWTQILRTNATTKDFKLNLPVFQIKWVGVRKIGDTNWIPQSVASDKEQDRFYTAWFYKKGDNVLYSNKKNDPIGFGYEIKVIYNSYSKGSFTATNDEEALRIGKLQGSDKPFYRNKIIRKNDITNTQELVNYANFQLEKYSKPYRPVTVYTRTTPLLNSNSNPVKLNWKYPIQIIPTDETDTLNGDYIVNQIRISGNRYDLEYAYKLTPTLNDDMDINFYDDRLRESENLDDFVQRIDINQDWVINFQNAMAKIYPDTPTTTLNWLPTNYKLAILLENQFLYFLNKNTPITVIPNNDGSNSIRIDVKIEEAFK